MTLVNKYLKYDPTAWLLEESDPSIRYLFKKEILKDPDSDAYYEHLLGDIRIKNILNGSGRILGSIKKFDIFYRGTMWFFAEAIEHGLDKRTPAVDMTAEYILQTFQTPSGGFTLNWEPQHAVSCRTGDMVRFLIGAGLMDDRIEKGIRWILRHQRHDGGWLHCPISGLCDQINLVLFRRSGKGLKREERSDTPSCIFASIACGLALAEYARKTNSSDHDEIISKAAEYFLNHSFFTESSKFSIIPKYSRYNDFTLLGYPVLSQYDILHGLLFIAQIGLFHDRRCGEAFNIIMSKQNEDGTWNLEEARTGMMYGNTKKNNVGKKSKWVTLKVLRLLNIAGR